MARCSCVSLLLLAVARTALPADTGMLYIKSDPPGATVVIGGVERGKTPVLLKNLPAGETEITLRFEGAEPVVVRETIVAKRVTRLSADIDVPGASLTIISDPLEATVYLDEKEHGETPTTIEGLLPGRHHLLLLKAGLPRTTRSIILAAGEERVLEIKLGTAQAQAQAEEETTPPPSRTAAPTSRVPEAMQEFFKEFLALVEKGDLAAAQKLAKRASAGGDLAEFRAHVLAAAEAAKLLGDLDEAAKRGAKSLVGKKTELATKTGTREGRVKAVDDECITLMKEIKVGRRVVGGTRSRVAWSDLTPEALVELAKGWPPDGTTGAVAQALAARARGDVKGIQSALEGAGGDLLGQYLRERTAAASESTMSAEIRAEWEGIRKRTLSSKISATAARKLLADIDKLKTRLEESGVTVPSAKQVHDAELRARTTLVRAAGVPREAVEFQGHSYMLYDLPVSWPRAKALCERAKGHLVTIASHGEQRFVLGMGRGRTKGAWIGLTDIRREGRWEWVTGERLDFTVWGPRQPDDTDGEDYGQLVFENPDGGGLSGRWNDVNLQTRSFFICEWEFAAGTE